jgi:hypothetical protein
MIVRLEQSVASPALPTEADIQIARGNLPPRADPFPNRSRLATMPPCAALSPSRALTAALSFESGKLITFRTVSEAAPWRGPGQQLKPIDVPDDHTDALVSGPMHQR